MTDFEREILNKLDSLESEVQSLRAELRRRNNAPAIKPAAERVTVAQIAAAHSVSRETVRKMQGEFSGLYAMHKTTETGRIYWDKADYDAWARDKQTPVKEKAAREVLKRRKLLVRKAA